MRAATVNRISSGALLRAVSITLLMPLFLAAAADVAHAAAAHCPAEATVEDLIRLNFIQFAEVPANPLVSEEFCMITVTDRQGPATPYFYEFDDIGTATSTASDYIVVSRVMGGPNAGRLTVCFASDPALAMCAPPVGVRPVGGAHPETADTGFTLMNAKLANGLFFNFMSDGDSESETTQGCSDTITFKARPGPPFGGSSPVCSVGTTPEPSSAYLLFTGAMGLGVFLHRRRWMR